MKSRYNLNNSELLNSNNSISTKLIKDLLKIKTVDSEFTKEVGYILQNIDLMDILMVRDLVKDSIQSRSV